MGQHKKLSRIASVFMVVTLLFWTFFPYIALAGSFITPGKAIDPGKAVQGGKPISGGNFIIPGQVYTPGTPANPGGTNGTSGQIIFPALPYHNGVFIIPNSPPVPPSIAFTMPGLNVGNASDPGNPVTSGNGQNGGNGIEGGKPGSTGKGPNGGIGLNDGQGLNGGQASNGSQGLVGGQATGGGQATKGNSALGNGTTPNGAGGNEAKGDNSASKGNGSEGLNASLGNFLIEKMGEAKDLFFKGNDALEGIVAQMSGFRLTELSDGRYRIEGKNRFASNMSFFEGKLYSYLNKFQNNQVILKSKSNGEIILRSSKKISQNAVEAFTKNNFNFAKSMSAELKNNWSFTGSKFWGPKELLKGNGLTNILLSTGGTLYDYTFGPDKGKMASTDFAASLSSDVTIGIGTAAVSTGTGILASALAGAATGSVVPGIGTVAGAVAGIVVTGFLNNTSTGRKIKDGVKSGFKWAYDGIASGGKKLADKIKNSSFGSTVAGFFK
ncbi:hypothetical protein [Peribacillus alkalitolerans]|uniref:hypothetical protein n=1 Tax=Peribacillus alkalitolerans TaxID=1550385 RepID=UPI0013D737F2|nr:hypothetical protein [Peribacillus alkalitolerans]